MVQALLWVLQESKLTAPPVVDCALRMHSLAASRHLL